MRVILTGAFFLITYLAICFSASAKPLFVDSNTPPPGFESESMNQRLRVSVLFMNKYVGVYYINIVHGELKFQSPENLANQLGGLKDNKKIVGLLSQSFSLNIECYTNSIASVPRSCDRLKKQKAYIIYHPQQEMVYLYLAPTFFKKPRQYGELEFIPGSTSGWSYLNKLGAAGSFSNDDPLPSRIYSSLPNYYNLYSNNTLAYGNSSIVGNFSDNNGINNVQHFQVQNLYGQHYVRDKLYTAGYILNAASPFFQTQTLLGAGMKTTLETTKNADEITASPIVIFVPEASQVSVFKNEQLIFSEYLEAGYQRINTNNFPDGGYELTIKIGSNNTIRRFFNKGFVLPPIHATQYYLMGGYLTNGLILNDNTYNFLPDTLGIPVLQAGINKRMNERIALSSNILLNSRQGLIDFGPSFFIGSSFIKAAGLVTSKNNYGVYTMLNVQKNRINLNLIATKIFYQNTHPDYFFLNNIVDNDSISLSIKLSEYDLIGVQGNYNKPLEQPHSYNVGTFYQRLMGNYKGMGFFFNAGYNKAIYVGDTYNISLSINFNKDRLAGTESISWQDQVKSSRDNQFAVPIVAQGSTVYSHQDEQNLGYSINEFHTLSSTVSSLASTYNYTAKQGFVATYVNYNRIKNAGSTIGYGGNFETELAVNRSAARFNGIARGNKAGMMVSVQTSDRKDKSSKFALLDSNHHKIAILPANKKIFVSLPSFTDQDYTLINLSKADYVIKEPVRHVTLYPGNVAYYSWMAEKRIIVIGKVIAKHRPLVNAWIHAGRNGIFSDSEGNFQLELPLNTKSLAADDVCRIKLPKLSANRAYSYVGEIECS